MTEIDEIKYKKLLKRDTAIPLRGTKCKFFCPSCSRAICGRQNRKTMYGRIYYCPRCGQHLDTRVLLKD